MPAMLIRHGVADFTLWRPFFDEHGTTRRANGSSGGRIFRSADDGNEVLILLEWDDLARARLFADSDDLRETLAAAGVTDQPEIWFLEDIDRFTD